MHEWVGSSDGGMENMELGLENSLNLESFKFWRNNTKTCKFPELKNWVVELIFSHRDTISEIEYLLCTSRRLSRNRKKNKLMRSKSMISEN